jgi:hypothetical protein
MSPAGAFGGVLQPEELARQPDLIQPGNPDGSRLYNLMLARAMPPPASASEGRPSADDIEAVRDWISALAPHQGCGNRTAALGETTQAAMQRVLRSAGPGQSHNIRFLTLGHLWASCASEKQLAIYRQALGKLVNSLSRGSQPVSLPAIDENGTLLKLDLVQLGWDAASWERLVGVYPYAAGARVSPQSSLVRATGTSVPVLRGDWMAFAASRAPLYYELLGLPDTSGALHASLAVDTRANLESGKAKRVGVRSSSVTGPGRLIERHPLPHGALWTAYDLARPRSRQDLIDSLVRPASRPRPQHDAALTLFTLPNGFYAAFVADADGKRTDKVARTIVRDPSFPRRDVMVGLSCLSCHAGGVADVSGEIHHHSRSSGKIETLGRGKVVASTPTARELALLLAMDNQRYHAAMKAAGLDPALTLDGVEPIVALSARYERGLGLEQAAAELGLEPAKLLDMRRRLAGDELRFLQRLERGVVSRGEFETHYATLVAHSGGGAPPNTTVTPSWIGVSTRKEEHEPAADLTLIAERPRYKSGDLVAIIAKASTNCRLTLINIDPAGHATVLFPNGFDKENRLAAGKEIKIPADSAPYRFRLRDKGKETFVGICSADAPEPDGIKHEFERQPFTDIGDYRAFLRHALAGQGEERGVLPLGGPRKIQRETSLQRLQLQARTAIQVEVQ